MMPFLSLILGGVAPISKSTAKSKTCATVKPRRGKSS